MTNDFPNFDLHGKTALVTASARGLGRAIALALAHAGADVALGLRDLRTGSQLASEIERMGRRALPLQMDMTQMDQISAAVGEAAAEFGRLDILVNNAGIAPDNLAENVTESDFDATLAINLKGTFFASQAAGRVMIRQKYGRIINMSSQAGFAALPTESIYCMTKAGIAHLTEYLAVPANRADTVERIAALHRIGEPMDVAGSVVFLASDAASLITGHTILIDGGWTAR
jgi:NAD(P)-dependent dehydrogenase (short-subunit alcohol dehydrogenase family)